MPGSSPLFGLNALGGAFSIQTKTGFSHPGHLVAVSGGSFGRRWVDARGGGHSDRVSYFVAGTASGGRLARLLAVALAQLFGSVEWRGSPSSTLRATVTAGSNRLIGNGPAPVSCSTRIARRSSRTPTRRRLTRALDARGSRVARPRCRSTASCSTGRAIVGTFNGDDHDYDECEHAPSASSSAPTTATGEPVAISSASSFRSMTTTRSPAPTTRRRRRTHGWGGSLQVTVARQLVRPTNHFIAGASFDGAGSRTNRTPRSRASPTSAARTAPASSIEDAAVRLQTTVRTPASTSPTSSPSRPGHADGLRTLHATAHRPSRPARRRSHRRPSV